MRQLRPIEPGLIRIFRYFVWAETFAFLLVPFAENMFFGEIRFFYQDPFFIIFLQSLFLSIYLSIPWLQRKLRQAYLLIAILIAIIIPSVVVYVEITMTLQQNQPIDTIRIWALLPLLMIPLVPAAWQYDFRIVFILFVGLGVLDAAHMIGLNNGVDMYILMPLFAIFIRVISLALVGLMITELMHIQRAQRKDLTRANLQLIQQGIVKEQLAISRERNRLARELHDTLAHTLSGLTVQLEAIQTVHASNDRLADMITNALKTSREGLVETRRALKALRVESLEEMGLKHSLQELTQRFKARCDIPLILELAENINQFTDEEEQTIYRITQEALENILKHARASRVRLSLEKRATQWVYSIEDDGKGFDFANEQGPTEGLGIKGMQERANAIGAELNIQSEPDKGTIIQLIMKSR